jgi:hypothetical protein
MVAARWDSRRDVPRAVAGEQRTDHDGGQATLEPPGRNGRVRGSLDLEPWLRQGRAQVAWDVDGPKVALD